MNKSSIQSHFEIVYLCVCVCEFVKPFTVHMSSKLYISMSDVSSCCAIMREKKNVIALHILIIDCYSMRETVSHSLTRSHCTSKWLLFQHHHHHQINIIIIITESHLLCSVACATRFSALNDKAKRSKIMVLHADYVDDSNTLIMQDADTHAHTHNRTHFHRRRLLATSKSELRLESFVKIVSGFCG